MMVHEHDYNSGDKSLMDKITEQYEKISSENCDLMELSEKVASVEVKLEKEQETTSKLKKTLYGVFWINAFLLLVASTCLLFKRIK